MKRLYYLMRFNNGIQRDFVYLGVGVFDSALLESDLEAYMLHDCCGPFCLWHNTVAYISP